MSGEINQDGDTLTVRVPLTFRKRGGRKFVIAPEGQDTWAPPRPRVDNAMVKAIVRAFRWRKLLETGSIATVGEIAEAEKINASYVGRVLRLTLLSPEIVEAILDGRQPADLQLQDLLRPFPVGWRSSERDFGLSWQTRVLGCAMLPNSFGKSHAGGQARLLASDVFRRRISKLACHGSTTGAWARSSIPPLGPTPGVKQQLAAVRMLFDWLITGQVVPINPASAVRGPKHVVKTGKTPVLDGSEWRKLIDSIPTDTVRDLRDRALIATLTYGFARISAALKMKVEDLQPKGAGWRAPAARERRQAARDAVPSRARRGAARLHRRRRHRRGPQGLAVPHQPRDTAATVLADQPMAQSDAWRMIRRRAVAAGIMRRSAITVSARPGSRPILPTAARWSMRRRWPRTRARAPPSSTTGRRNGLPPGFGSFRRATEQWRELADRH